MSRREAYVPLTLNYLHDERRTVWVWAPEVTRVDEYRKNGAQTIVYAGRDKLYVQETPSEVLERVEVQPPQCAEPDRGVLGGYSHAEWVRAASDYRAVSGGNFSLENHNATKKGFLDRARAALAEPAVNRLRDQVYATPDELVAAWLRERGQVAVPVNAAAAVAWTGERLVAEWALGLTYKVDWFELSDSSRAAWNGLAGRINTAGRA